MLQLSGHGIARQPLSRDEIVQLPRHELGATEVLCMTGRHVFRAESFVGVRLTDILNRAGLAALPRGELKQCVIVAQASDGYRAIFSWNELHNTPVGERVLVVYERDGVALAPQLGDLCLLSANDLHLGPRHLRDLREISVQML